MKAWRTDLDNMVYIIRDEGIKPIAYLKEYIPVNKLIKAQSQFVYGLSELMKNTFPNTVIKLALLEEQVEQANMALKNRSTISLDPYFEGDYNLETTRLFTIVNGQTKFVELTNRQGKPTINEQIDAIEPGEYVLVDDDAIGGTTINTIKELMKNKVKITDTYLLMNVYRNEYKENILDVIDSRDFIAGIQNSGLTVKLRGLGILRVPYMYPFIDIDDKANIPEGMEVEISQQIWKLNKEFWNNLGENIKLKDVGTDFIRLSSMFGIDNNTEMYEVCSIYYALSKNGVLINT